MTAATRVNAVLQLYHKAALSEIIQVSGNSKSRAAAQARTSWAQRLSTAQAESSPPKHNPKHLHTGQRKVLVLRSMSSPRQVKANKEIKGLAGENRQA